MCPSDTLRLSIPAVMNKPVNRILLLTCDIVSMEQLGGKVAWKGLCSNCLFPTSPNQWRLLPTGKKKEIMEPVLIERLLLCFFCWCQNVPKAIQTGGCTNSKIEIWKPNKLFNIGRNHSSKPGYSYWVNTNSKKSPPTFLKKQQFPAFFCLKYWTRGALPGN